MNAARSSGSSCESSSSSLASIARASGASARSASGTSWPWTVLSRTTCGLSVRRPNERSGFLSSAESSSVATVLPCFEGGLDDLDELELLELRASRSGRGFLTLASSRSARLVTTPRSAKSSSSRKCGELGRRVAAGEPVQDDQQGVALADQGEPLGVVGVRAGQQPGRVEELDRGRRDLLGLVQRGEVVQPRVRKRGDAHLAGVDLARVGTWPRSGVETTCSCRFRRTRRFRHAFVFSPCRQ